MAGVFHKSPGLKKAMFVNKAWCAVSREIKISRIYPKILTQAIGSANFADFSVINLKKAPVWQTIDNKELNIINTALKAASAGIGKFEDGRPFFCVRIQKEGAPNDLLLLHKFQNNDNNPHWTACDLNNKIRPIFYPGWAESEVALPNLISLLGLDKEKCL